MPFSTFKRLSPVVYPLRLVEHRYLIAFASGSVVAIALFTLIPDIQTRNAWMLLLGFFSIYSIIRYFYLPLPRRLALPFHFLPCYPGYMNTHRIEEWHFDVTCDRLDHLAGTAIVRWNVREDFGMNRKGVGHEYDELIKSMDPLPAASGSRAATSL